MDLILRNLGYIFQILARRLEAMAKSVLWVTFPAKYRLITFSYTSMNISA